MFHDADEAEPDAWTRYDQARALHFEGLDDRAAQRFEQAARLADDLEHPRARFLALSARVARANSLERAGRLGEALAGHREVIERYGRDAGRQERELVARSMGMQAQLFAKLERYDEARASVDRLRAVFGTAPEPAIQETVRIARRMRTAPPRRLQWVHRLNPLDVLERWAARER